MSDIEVDFFNWEDGNLEPSGNRADNLMTVYTRAQQYLAMSPHMETAETAALILSDDSPIVPLPTFLRAGSQKPSTYFTLALASVKYGEQEITTVTPAIIINANQLEGKNFDQQMHLLADDLLLANGVATRFVESGLTDGFIPLYMSALEQRDREIMPYIPDLLRKPETENERINRYRREIQLHLGTRVFLIDCGTNTIKQVAKAMLDELTQPQLFTFSTGYDNPKAARIRRGSVLNTLRMLCSDNPDEEENQENLLEKTMTDETAVTAIFSAMVKAEASRLSDEDTLRFTSNRTSQLYPPYLGNSARKSEAAIASILALPDLQRQIIAARTIVEHLLQETQ